MNLSLDGAVPYPYTAIDEEHTKKQKLQKKFTKDLAERSQAELAQALHKFLNDTLKFKVTLSYACDASVNCYHGNHDIY